MNKKYEYEVRVEKCGKWRVTHRIPIMSEQEREEKKKEILLGLYNLFFNGTNSQCTKVNQ